MDARATLEALAAESELAGRLVYREVLPAHAARYAELERPLHDEVAALVGRHARLDGMGLADVYRLGRIAQQLDPARVRSVTIPIGGGGCLSLGGGASSLFADFADDATLQRH